MEPKTILITGGSSIIAETLIEILLNETDHKLSIISSNADSFRTNERLTANKVDLVDIKNLKSFCYNEKPDVIVNTASVNDLELCEKNHKLAWDINVIAVENLASIARVLDIHFITISSDLVFDGRKGPYDEEAKPDPLNYFGKTKHAAENICLTSVNKGTIVRTSNVYGFSSFFKKDFTAIIFEKVFEEKSIEVTDNFFSTPTLADDVALTIFRIIEKERLGIYNAAGNSYINKATLVEQIFLAFQQDNKFIKFIPKKDFKQMIRIPEKAGLINLKAETDLSVKFSSFEDGLATYRYKINNFNKAGFLG